jgi:hypothetical protein
MLAWRITELSMADKDDVYEILAPFHRRIRSVIERAWDERRAEAAWRLGAGMESLLYDRTVANYIFDAIARIAVNEFASDTSVHVKVEAQTIKLFFRGGVVARFKKGDENKLGQNNPTQASMAFECADGILPDMPPETAKVEFIWIANELNTRLEQVLVVARDGDRLIWEYEIEPEADAGLVVPFPSMPEPPQAGKPLVTVKPQTPDSEEEEK